jgi:hypothetical protein
VVGLQMGFQAVSWGLRQSGGLRTSFYSLLLPSREAVSFLKAVVAFRVVAEGNARQALLRVAKRLSVELGYAGAGTPLHADPFAGGRREAQANILDPEDELLVAEVRSGLTRLAEALGAAEHPEAVQRLLATTLDGAEMRMRAELMRGRCERLSALMPSFVFLVALPIVPEDEAFDLSQRTAELLSDVPREL